MKKLLFVFVMLFLSSRLFAQSWPYVEGPETGVVGVQYTYSVGGTPVDTAYIWTLYHTTIIFENVVIHGTNTIDLTFTDPGRYFLVSDHGYDLEINISASDITSYLGSFTAQINTGLLSSSKQREHISTVSYKRDEGLNTLHKAIALDVDEKLQRKSVNVIQNSEW